MYLGRLGARFGRLGAGASSGSSSTPTFSLTAPVATWLSSPNVNIPQFGLDFTDPQIGQVVTLYRDTDVGFGSPETFTDTITSVAPLNTLDFATGAWDDDEWFVYFTVTDGILESDPSNTVTETIATGVDGRFFANRYFAPRHFPERYFG